MARTLIGREGDLASIQAFLLDVKGGPAIMLLEGDPGIGKTSVWEAGLTMAEDEGLEILSFKPSQAETSMAFAGLTDLLADVPDEAFAPLGPQRDAVMAALLRSAAPATADPRALSMGTLGVVCERAANRPVLLAIDDLQWVDKGTIAVLAFVLRRLEDESVGLLATARTEEPVPASFGLERQPEGRVRRRVINPLGLEETQELIADRLERTFPRALLTRVHRASGGNPLFALELATAAADRGALRPDQPLEIPGTLREAVAGRVQRLPEAVRPVILATALQARPSVSILKAALGSGIDDHLKRAVRTDVLRLDGDRIRFSHPLLAEVAIAEATEADRRALHRKLADAVTDHDERARHLALSIDEPDEAVAAELEKAAHRAHVRGAVDAASELADLSRKLTPDTEREARRRRTSVAGDYRFAAFDVEGARALLQEVVDDLEPGPARAEVLIRLSQVLLYGDDQSLVLDILRKAVDEAGTDIRVRAAAEMHLAFQLGVLGQFAASAEAARKALPMAEAHGDPIMQIEFHFMIAMANMADDPKTAAAHTSTARNLLDRVAPGSGSELPMAMRPLSIVGFLLKILDDLSGSRVAYEGEHRTVMDRGAEMDLPILLGFLAELECWAGRLDVAAEYAARAYRVSLLSDSPSLRSFGEFSRTLVAAYRGDLDSARDSARKAIRAGTESGLPQPAVYVMQVMGFVELSAGDHAAAHEQLQPLVDFVRQTGIRDPAWIRFQPDEIEAMIGLGRLDEALEYLEGFESAARKTGRPWPLATAARSRGLMHAALGELVEAEQALQEALGHHGRLAMPFELARSLLALGQVQRRLKRRRAARETLARAASIFEQYGNAVWRAKVEAELARLGGRHAAGGLTETESRVAELIAEGLTNREVATRLFMSPRTVEATLARAYRKLGVASRAELGSKIAERESAPERS
jgi:DNA-binding CsgD family transcriptional regulator